MTTMTFSSS